MKHSLFCVFCLRDLSLKNKDSSPQWCSTCGAVYLVAADLLTARNRIAAQLKMDPVQVALSSMALSNDLILVVGYNPNEELTAHQVALIENRSRLHILRYTKAGKFRGAHQDKGGRKTWRYPRWSLLERRRARLLSAWGENE